MSGKIAMKKKKCDLIKNHTQIYTFILITAYKNFLFQLLYCFILNNFFNFKIKRYFFKAKTGRPVYIGFKLL